MQSRADCFHCKLNLLAKGLGGFVVNLLHRTQYTEILFENIFRISIKFAYVVFT